MVRRSFRDEVDPDGVIVDDHELLGLLQRSGAHLERREAANRHRAIERPLHVLSGDRRAVLEFCILAQLERGGHVADVHVLGQFHLELVAVVVLHPVGQRFHLVADEPVVAVPRHLVARHVGADAVNVDIVRPALGDDEQRLLARLRLGGRTRRREREGRSQHSLQLRFSESRDASCRPRLLAINVNGGRSPQRACQAASGRCGWDLSVSPEKKNSPDRS